MPRTTLTKATAMSSSMFTSSGIAIFLASTSLPDGMYYEVTFNKDKGEIYLDAYKKFDNLLLSGSL